MIETTGKMHKTQKVSYLQIIYIIVICRIITAYAALPEVNTPPANQDVWVISILSIIYIFIISAPLLFLTNRFSNMTPVQYSKKIMGKFLGIFPGMVFTTFMFFISLLHLAQFIVFLDGVLLQETPTYVIMIFMIAICSYTAYMGIECIARVSEIFVPIVLFAIILFMILSINNMDFNAFLPILYESDFLQINFGAFSIASRFSDLIIFCMLVPYCNKIGDCNLTKGNSKGIFTGINKVFLIIVIACTVLFLLIIISTQSVLGIEISKQENYPFYKLVGQISLFEFIERIESLYIIIWGIGAFIKFSVFLYFTSVGIQQVLSVKSNKIFIIPIGVILFMIILLTNIKSIEVTRQIFSYKFIPNIIFAIIFGIPLILLIVYIFRKKSNAY